MSEGGSSLARPVLLARRSCGYVKRVRSLRRDRYVALPGRGRVSKISQFSSSDYYLTLLHWMLMIYINKSLFISHDFINRKLSCQKCNFGFTLEYCMDYLILYDILFNCNIKVFIDIELSRKKVKDTKVITITTCDVRLPIHG